MRNEPLYHQLRSLRCLDTEDFNLLGDLFTEEVMIDKGERWIVEGSEVSKVSVLSKGWAVRYKSLRDGRRQILNFLLPGDIVGFFALLFKTAEYGVEPMMPIALHSFAPSRVFDAFRQSPLLAIALSWLAGQAERQLDEQIVRVGRRGATERMAHLFMELHHRLLRVGISDGDARLFPLTQTILADALGMSHIHANRSFRTLVRDGLVTLRNGKILLQDTEQLSRLAGFDVGYLEQEPLPPSTRRALPQ